MTDPAPGTAVALAQPRAARQIIPVDDVVPIYDTARFEHYQRIATVMSAASLVPDDLRGSGGQQAVGNCFMVVALADRLGMDPFMLAQCCSVVHGKLMLEGKVVDAALRGKRKLALTYYFTGDRGADNRRIYVSREKLTEEEVKALRPGVYPYGHEDMIDGSIGEWKTKEKGGAVKAAWQGAQSDIQLRYRGTRVWARVNDPGIMLGVYTDDEMDEVIERRAELAAASAQRRLTSGFGDGTDEAFRTGAAPKPQKAPQTAKTDPAPEDAAPAPDPSPAPAEAQDGADAIPTEMIEFGIAEPGETYLMAGDGYNDKERRQTYRDGKPFSTVTQSGAGKLKVYEEHAPEVADDSGAGETTTSPPSSDASPDPAGGTEAERTSDSPPIDRAENGSQAQDDIFPGDLPSGSQPPPPAEKPRDTSPFADCHAQIAEAKTWPAIKQAMRTLSKTPAWAECEDEGKRMIRSGAWDRFTDLREAGDKTDVINDLTLFRLWLEFGAETEDEVDGLWRVFYRQPAYLEASEGDKRGMTQLMQNRKVELSGRRS